MSRSVNAAIAAISNFERWCYAEKTYSTKERKAFHMGRAYAAAKAGKRVKLPDDKTKQSFRNGVNSVRGKKTPAKKKTRAKPAGSCYLVDGDGVIVGVVKRDG